MSFFHGLYKKAIKGDKLSMQCSITVIYQINLCVDVCI